MGLSLKVFIVNDDDTILPLSFARYERLIARNSKEVIPQFAEKRVRYGLAVVDLINRKPIEIVKIQYSYLSFDSEGRIDSDFLKEESRLGLDILPPILKESNPQPVIDARHKFAQKRFDRQYKWEPSPEIESAIFNLIFKK
jgi:hypothetical protein